MEDKILEEILNKFSETTIKMPVKQALEQALRNYGKRRKIYIRAALDMLEKCIFIPEYQSLVDALKAMVEG